MKANKIWLMGGFGNVLFQILAYRILQKKQKSPEFVDFLTKKNIVTSTIKWSIHQDLYKDLVADAKFYNPSIFNAILTIFFSSVSKKTNLSFGFVKFYKGTLDLEKSVSNHVFGYFQENDFLNRNADEILKLGEQLNALYSKKSKYDVVIHFRGGDAYSEEHKSYYEKVQILAENLANSITVVTDNLELASTFFGKMKNEVEVIRSENALDDFAIMVSSKILYCAPSTFSWWAAQSIDKNSIVYLPKDIFDRLGFYNINATYKII